MTEKELKKYTVEFMNNETGSNRSNINSVMGKMLIKYAEIFKKRIAELEDKLANADYQLEGRDNEIRELEKEIENYKLSEIEAKEIMAEQEEQIEKMKNCKNCANYMISGKCPCFFRTGWCKNWEMAKGDK